MALTNQKLERIKPCVFCFFSRFFPILLIKVGFINRQYICKD
ncbi:hypothetical protein [Acinetobacter sp.]